MSNSDIVNRYVEKFVKGPGNYKYTAILKDGSPWKTNRVNFGDRRYQHYYDKTPLQLNGGKYHAKDHLDKERRSRYRLRHKMIKNKQGLAAYQIPLSPAWFSYHFLW